MLNIKENVPMKKTFGVIGCGLDFNGLRFFLARGFRLL